MKIILIDKIIDTGDIFSISEIYSHPDGREFMEHKFFITFYDKSTQTVMLRGESSDEYKLFWDDFYDKIDEYKEGKWTPSMNDELLLQKSAPIIYEKVKSLHTRLVDCWSNNQSTLPKFVFE